MNNLVLSHEPKLHLNFFRTGKEYRYRVTDSELMYKDGDTWKPVLCEAEQLACLRHVLSLSYRRKEMYRP